MSISGEYRAAHNATAYQFSNLAGLVTILQDICFQRLQESTCAKDDALMALVDVIGQKIKEVEISRSAEWVAALGAN